MLQSGKSTTEMLVPPPPNLCYKYTFVYAQLFSIYIECNRVWEHASSSINVPALCSGSTGFGSHLQHWLWYYGFAVFYAVYIAGWGAWLAQSVQRMGTSWAVEKSKFDCRQEIFLFPTSPRLVLWPTQPPAQLILRALSLRTKRVGREADHSHLVPG
jgi:hypothetical protein